MINKYRQYHKEYGEGIRITIMEDKDDKLEIKRIQTVVTVRDAQTGNFVRQSESYRVAMEEYDSLYIASMRVAELIREGTPFAIEYVSDGRSGDNRVGALSAEDNWVLLNYVAKQTYRLKV